MFTVLQRRFPDGMKVTTYKRTCVEEYAPYVSEDGLVVRITRYEDFDCTEINSIEDKYENRHDKLYRAVFDVKSNIVTDYFAPGREDSVIKHVFHKNNDAIDAERTIFYNHKARYDSLAKIECKQNELTEYYQERDDRLYYRKVEYSKKRDNAQISLDDAKEKRKPILEITQKFHRNEDILASQDIAVRVFAVLYREIHLKFHYGKGAVTASTRTFIKPSISEMGEGMVFKPELTSGYQAEIGEKPPSKLSLYLLLEQQLKEEEIVINSIRDMENQIAEFLLQRAHEMAFSKLDVSLFNKEQNIDFRMGMLEKEEQQRVCKEKEVEEEIDYLAPYLAKLGNPSSLTYQQALEVKYNCLDDFKKLLVERANAIHRTYERLNDQLQSKQNWYTLNHDNLQPDEEAKYFEQVNDMLFYLKTLEIRINRHKDLSPLRYEAMMAYLNNHPLLEVL